VLASWDSYGDSSLRITGDLTANTAPHRHQMCRLFHRQPEAIGRIKQVVSLGNPCGCGSVGPAGVFTAAMWQWRYIGGSLLRLLRVHGQVAGRCGAL
jgi:hypothetical protein